MSASAPQPHEDRPSAWPALTTTLVTIVLFGGVALWYQPWRFGRSPATDAGRAAGIIATPTWPREISNRYGEVIVSPSGLVVQADGARAFAAIPRSVPGRARSAVDVVAVPVRGADVQWVAQLIDEANRIRHDSGLAPVRTVIVPVEQPSAD